jgi:hypothetical protein
MRRLRRRAPRWGCPRRRAGADGAPAAGRRAGERAGADGAPLPGGGRASGRAMTGRRCRAAGGRSRLPASAAGCSARLAAPAVDLTATAAAAAARPGFTNLCVQIAPNRRPAGLICHEMQLWPSIRATVSAKGPDLALSAGRWSASLRRISGRAPPDALRGALDVSFASCRLGSSRGPGRRAGRAFRRAWPQRSSGQTPCGG